MIVNFNIAVDKTRKKLIEGLIKTTLKYSRAAYKKVYVEISMVEESEIKELNNKFRHINEVTDVLSFPSLNLTPYEKINIKNHLTDVDPKTKHLNLGDIIICTDKAKAKAEEYGHSLDREICYLIVHGLLHLLGYDHEKQEEKFLMRGLEEEVLNKFKIKREQNED